MTIVSLEETLYRFIMNNEPCLLSEIADAMTQPVNKVINSLDTLVKQGVIEWTYGPKYSGAVYLGVVG